MPTIVQTFQGKVTGLWGTAHMRGADGKMHLLQLGDLVHKGDVILTTQNGIVQLDADATGPLPANVARATGAPVAEIDRVIAALNEPSAQDDATAAGVSGGDGAGDLSPGLRVERISESVTPAGLTPAGADDAQALRPVAGGAVANDDRNNTNVVPPALSADSNVIDATEEGAAVGLGLTAPTGTTPAAVITITEVPVIGQLLKADGTVIVAGSVISAADLVGLKYLPPADYNGSAPVGELTYTVTEGNASATGTVGIVLTAVNDAPIAVADAATGLEDTVITGNVLANDSDVDGPALQVTQYAIAGVAHAAGTSTALAGIGSINVNADGSYVFTPVADYHGPVPVIGYTVSDGSLTSSSTLTLNVTPVNDAPDAVDDQVSTAVNVAVTIPVLANDHDRDGDRLTVTGATLANPAQGSLTVNPDGSVSFTPATNVTGTVLINYTVSDGHGGTDTATVTVNVGVNTPPAGADSTHVLNEDGSYTVVTADFGFTDADAGQTLANVRIDTLPAAGTLLLNGVALTAGAVVSAADVAAGHLVFVPAADGNGAPYAGFTFSVQDSAGAFDPAPNTLTFNVTPQPDAAVISGNAAGATVEDTTLVASGQLHVADPDAGEAAFVVQSGVAGAHGTFSIDATGQWTYTLNNADPAVQALGAGQTLPSEVFTVRSIDGTTAQVTVSITGTDDVPVISVGSGTVTENLVPSTSGTLTATDVDNSALAFVPATVSGSYGALVLQADGHWTYTLDARAEALAAGQVVSEPMTVTLNDGSTTTVTISITGTDDASVITPAVANLTETNAVLSTGGTLTITDVDSPTSFIPQTNVAGTAGYGHFTLDANGAWTYTTDTAHDEFVAGTTYTDTLTVTAADGTTSTITVNILGTNDAAVITPAVANLTETNAVLSTSGTLAITDVDSPATFFAQNNVAGTNGYGLFTVHADGTWTYVTSTAHDEFVAGSTYTDQITVTSADGTISTITVNILGTNDAPTLSVPGAQNATEDTNQVITGVSIADVDSTSLTTTLTVAHGTLSVATGGGASIANNNSDTITLSGTAAQINAALAAITYKPNADFNGADTLNLVTSDGSATTNAAVAIALAAVPDIVADVVRTTENVPVTFNPITGLNEVSGADNFEDAGRTLTAVGTPAHGSVTFAADGTITYTPDSHYSGSDTFTYTVTAGGVTETATITVNLSPVNDAAVPTLSVTPIGRWTFDETSGPSTTDAYNAQNGTLTDSVPTPSSVLPTWTTGHTGTSGTALHFDGTGSYVALSATTTAPLMGTSSLTFWIKTTQTGSNSGWDSPAVIASEQAGGTDDIQWGVLNPNGQIGFDLGNAPGVYSTTAVNDNAWHQVAITRDGATGFVSVYVDGLLEATGSPQDSGFTATLNRLVGFGSTNNFNNDASGTDLTDYRFLNADLDDVRIYSHVLTADQVAAIKSVESGYHDVAVANDGDAIHLSLAATNYTALSVSGLNTGMVIADGAGGHTTTIGASGTDSVVDLTGWNLSSLSVSGAGTGSATLVFHATDTVAGESHSTTQYLNIVNGTSLLGGGVGDDTLTGTSSADLIVGNAGNDTIDGGAGNDRLIGGAGNDTINGGSGNDIIYGGAGNDVMTGGTGADTFAWHLADRGTAGAPATDSITDFDVAPVASGGDTLDLRDLLVGANHVGTDPGNLAKYLDFDTTSTPGSTVIHVSSTGGYAGGNYAAASTDETITLQGVDLRSAMGLGSGASDHQIITELLTRNKLVTDGP